MAMPAPNTGATGAQTELVQAEAFVQKLHSFNTIAGEMHAVLGLDVADLASSLNAERDLSALVARFQAAQKTLSDAETAAASARETVIRLNVERESAHKRAEATAQRTIEAVDAKDDVRPEYKSGLHDVFDFGHSRS